MAFVNLVKLCVGVERLEELQVWQASRAAELPGGRPRHVTRMWPKRAEEILAGGSLYWVIKGVVLARQRIVALDPVEGADGITRCGIVLDPVLVRTEPAVRRPFQGWRYLPAAEAPRDLALTRAKEEALPPALAAALADLGVR